MTSEQSNQLQYIYNSVNDVISKGDADGYPSLCFCDMGDAKSGTTRTAEYNVLENGIFLVILQFVNTAGYNNTQSYVKLNNDEMVVNNPTSVTQHFSYAIVHALKGDKITAMVKQTTAGSFGWSSNGIMIFRI